jgi:hypothetical protein
MDKNTPPTGKPISRNDLENRLRTLKSDVDTVKDSTIGAGIAAAAGVALLIVIVAFLLGRSRGKAALSFIEVRRG